MTSQFSQHELEIIKGHEKILETTDKGIIEKDLKKMIDLLESEDGKQYIKDDSERHYTLKHYRSAYDKMTILSDKEFKKIDFDLLDYFDE
ncbi:TPA: hypothetical protein REB85_002971 [Listeria monocytogenes]|uniref:hypothetical protein n=1 Tax=Bacilli TaxID=91061 RepID=UPI0010EC633F|nr:hypothetical protein [Listeria innocua]EAE6963907.1 hypothetical protein [Listeria monocytogenes]EAV9844981.1 hypothetical protein [Listeria monocytogenes]MCP7998320.1 hypothetical protein [Listeria monocytogenes]MCP8136776.1 hypothetical protein [Listeria monocytogenes]MCP8253640.1 hypothetical protein [Listeria monocytogenes]